LLDSLGLGDRLAARLTAAGCEVTTAQAGEAFSRLGPGRYSLDPHVDDGFAGLLADLGTVPDHILHLWSLGAPEERVEAEEALARGYETLLALTRALARREGPGAIEICVIANGFCDVGNDRLHPEKATLLGPLRVIPQEHPGIACRLIDVDAGEIGPALETRLFTELGERSVEPVVAWRGPHRWLPVWEPAPLAPVTGRPTLLRAGGTYLITGGLGGLGLALANHLWRTAGARLVLVGRSALPARERWPARAAGEDELARRLRELLALEAAGAEVLVVAADVADAPALRRALAAARQRFGRIDGVFHTAGVPGAGLLQLKTREAARPVLAPKVAGTLVLETVLGDDPPDFLVLFSSINAVLGGIGQVDYSAANAFLGAFARSRSARGGMPVIAVDWCEWRFNRWTDELVTDPGVRAALRRHRENLGLSFAEGMEALDRILESGLPEVVVSTRDFAAVIHSQLAPAQGLDGLAALAGSAQGRRGHQRPALQTPWAAPSTPAEEKMAALWGELLGIEPIGAHDDFFQLGGHSLLGLQLVARIQAGLGVELPLRTLFEAPTLAELAARVEAELRAGAGRVTPPLVRLAPALREGPLPLSFAQQRLWFLDQLEPGKATYHIPVTLRAEGPLQSAVLALCLGEIVRRHEALRTAFAEVEGAPVQVIREAAPFALPVVDLSGLPESRRAALGLTLAGEEAARPFDLTRGPLLRGALVRLAESDHVIALTLHHIASDG
ncbi:MAG TPA: SDR family NAD(P)-dependent oxidoreductase, partial [Thermoanaerobaculia bacterium]|nr:SDR family NAD(P)-dependent oxidoreductase [Thermoanaerobaculia bacterium]